MAAPSRAHAHDPPLLTTKLYTPSVRSALVPRPRLFARLDAGLTRKLTLVSAPAGFGKTTLVAAWLQQRAADSGAKLPWAWLSLDENDNDPVRFLTYLVAALQSVDPGIGRTAQAMLQAPQPPPPESLLTALINDVAATPHAFVLVLDDYHLIHTLPVHEQLAFLLAHQPPSMHLVLTTREDPPLPLPRWRARGQMVELRQADLAFTADEAADFWRVMGLALSSADVAALQRRTEGWIAGLQLAALSLQGRDNVRQRVQSFTGSHRYVLDYLIDEVFQGQSPDVQDFLLKTSILDRLCASLCDTVAERADSQRVLLALEQANLFIAPLDGARRWYRYHRLFAELLRQQLRTAERRDLVPNLHRRASHWYEAHGLAADAVQHALEGADWERAATLILGLKGSMFKRGEVVTLLCWYQALPDQELRARPDLWLEYCWALILTGQIDAAAAYLEEVEMLARDAAGLEDQAAPARWSTLLGEVLAAQAYVARIRGDDRHTIVLSQQALALLPQAGPDVRSVLSVNLGIAYWNSGHLAEAEQALTEARHAARQCDNHYARLTALGFLGTIQATWGKLHRAAALFEQAIASRAPSPPVALAHNSLGALCYEWNDLPAAADHLQRGIELSQRGGNPEIQTGSYRILARLRQAQGEAAGALDALQTLHQLTQEHNLSPLTRARNAACHVQVALCQGNLDVAELWSEWVTQDADASPFYPLLGLTPARLLLARGDKAAAAERLATCYETAVRAGWQFGVVEVRVLQALAAPTFTDARAFLSKALTLAEPEGYVRTFVDQGAPMVVLLQAVASEDIAPAYVDRLLAAMVVSSPPHADTSLQALIEPLSDRELDVLRLLAQGQTNHEIAQALCVSVNTIKTHLKNIYGKLGVHDRRQASAQARQLGLLV